jgi:hypothetical protein
MALFRNIETESMVTKVLLILSSVLFVALIVYILLDSVWQKPGENEVILDLPNMRLDAVVLKSRSSGALQWEMKAEKMEQEEGASQLTLGRINEWMFYNGSEKVMNVSAEGGRLSKRTEDVELQGPVEMWLWFDSGKGREQDE